jgi:3-methyladenine DNA glycosylase AlkD
MGRETYMRADLLIAELKAIGSKEKIGDYTRFFKTGPGQYGYGDLFLGVTIPQNRALCKKYQNLELTEINKLFISPYHEARLAATIILNHKFKITKTTPERKKLFEFYIKQVRAGWVNNWDIVDISAPYMGNFLNEFKDKDSLLLDLADSKSLWVRRTSIMLTFALIRQKDYHSTILISKTLLNDDHDLIHKAVGWMLREVGKRDLVLLKDFLTNYAAQMPRTMLRYAIEKFPENERKRWLKEGQ